MVHCHCGAICGYIRGSSSARVKTEMPEIDAKLSIDFPARSP